MVFDPQRVYELANFYLSQDPRIRYGQAIYNAAAHLYSALTLPLNGTEVDPFYVDERADAFILALTTASNIAQMKEQGTSIDTSLLKDLKDQKPS